MFIIYHNPRCSKSRNTLELLISNNVKFEIHNYLSNPLNKTQIEKILDLLKIGPHDLVRKNEKIYKDLMLEQSDDELIIEAMEKHPILIERPIVVGKNKAIIGRPPENVLKILN